MCKKNINRIFSILITITYLFVNIPQGYSQTDNISKQTLATESFLHTMSPAVEEGLDVISQDPGQAQEFLEEDQTSQATVTTTYHQPHQHPKKSLLLRIKHFMIATGFIAAAITIYVFFPEISSVWSFLPAVVKYLVVPLTILGPLFFITFITIEKIVGPQNNVAVYLPENERQELVAAAQDAQLAMQAVTDQHGFNGRRLGRSGALASLVTVLAFLALACIHGKDPTCAQTDAGCPVDMVVKQENLPDGPQPDGEQPDAGPPDSDVGKDIGPGDAKPEGQKRDLVPDQATDQATDKATDQATDKATDQATDKATDQATDKATDQATDKATDQATDKATDQATDKATDQATDKSTDQATDKSTDQATDKSTDQTPPDWAVPEGAVPDAAAPKTVVYSATTHPTGKIDYNSAKSQIIGSSTTVTPIKQGTKTIGMTVTVPASTSTDAGTPSAGVRVFTDPELPAPKTKDLAGAWNMEGTSSASFADQSGNHTSGTNTLLNINGTQTKGFGNKGKVIYFNKKGRMYIPGGKLDTNLAKISKDSVTVAAWLQVDKSNSGGEFVIVEQGRLGKKEVDYRLVLDLTTMKLKATEHPSTGKQVTTVGTIPYGKPVVVIMQRDALGNYKFYVNTVDVTDTSNKPMIPSSPSTKQKLTELHVNTLQKTGVRVDNLAIFNRLLSAAEKQQATYDTGNQAINPDGSVRKFDINYTATGPFIRRYWDNKGKYVDVKLDAKSIPTGVTITIGPKASSSFDPKNIVYVDTLAAPGTTIVIWGELGDPQITRGYFARDPDIQDDQEWAVIKDAVEQEKITGRQDLQDTEFSSEINNVVYVTNWEGVLLDNGLGFNINGKSYAAFTYNDTIYLPHPDIVYQQLSIELSLEDDRAIKLINERMNIILGHENFERSMIKDGNVEDAHERAINLENKLHGLNHADILTVLLETMLAQKTQDFDFEFLIKLYKNLIDRIEMPVNAALFLQITEKLTLKPMEILGHHLDQQIIAASI